MRTKIIGTMAATAVAALTLGGPGSPAQAETSAPSAAALAPSTIKWGACVDETLSSRGAQCAKISVPLDWAKPSGTKIKIAISRIKHTVKASKFQGVMLVNPGGPGGSGLIYSVAKGWVPKYRGIDVAGAYDWIGFDPRGVGDSEPQVVCNDQYAGYNRPRYDPSPEFPYTTYKVTDPWPARTNQYTADCKANNSAGILRHLTTKDVAKDMNAIRYRLGAGKINYLGFSYGTYLGQVYASLFPDRTRRMIFDGTVDPRDVWYEANLNQDVAFDRNINYWFRWVAKHDDVYHLGDTTAKVKKLWYDTRDALYADTVTAPEGEHGGSDQLGGSEWTDAFLYAGYYQSTWTDLGETFAAYVNDGDVGAFETAYLDASDFEADNGYAVYTGVQCTDVAWPKSWATWKKDNDKIAAVAPFETWSNAWYNEPCRHWPAPSRTPKKITGKGVSLLMLNETLDAATPYPGSLEVRRLFPKASLVATKGGTSHSNSLNGNACVDVKIARFLYNGKVPKRTKGNHADAYCKAAPQPEPQSPTARKQGSSALGQLKLEQQKIAAPR